MEKIEKILIATNNQGKYREICDLVPEKIHKYSPKELNISSPSETGKTYEENSKLKALYFCKKTNMVSLSDDSGLEIELLKGLPGIYSSRWGGPDKDFNLAIKKVFLEMEKENKNWINYNKAKFFCSMTLFWPNGENFSSTGIIEGRISKSKKGDKGFGYDPIFIPDGYTQTFGELNPEIKKSIDHRYKAFLKLKSFFN